MLEKGCRSVDITGCGVTSDLNESAIILSLAAASITPVDTLWKEREWT